MARKTNESQKKSKSSIHTDTKKAVLSVFLFAFSAIILISSFNIGGKLGNAIFSLLQYAFGWGAYLLAISLAVIGILIIKSISSLACTTTIASVCAMFLSLLGIIQMIFGYSSAAETPTGGKLGQIIGASLENMFGFQGGIILIFAFFIASILIALNISLITIWETIPKKKSASDISPDAQALNSGQNKKPLIESSSEEENVPPTGGWASIKKIISSKNIPGMDKATDNSPAENIINSKKKENGFSANKILFKNKSSKKSEDDANYKGFPLDILTGKTPEKNTGGLSSEDLNVTSNIIKKTLENFGISVEMKDINIGPTVAQYTLKPFEGVKLSRIIALQNDLALALAAHPIRIEAPIPGKSLVGIEVPNKSITTVRLRNLLEFPQFKNQRDSLCAALGLDVSGDPIYANLCKMPHLLIAGSTGSGKSVCINSILINLLYANSPKKLRLILVDPKRVELSCYNGIPHLLSPVIFDSGKTVSALKWAVKEMEERLKKLQDVGARDIISYNEKDPDEIMPYIVVVIDELADLMTGNSSNEVESGIVRLAQMARAVGIHLIVSTQRPSIEVITGLIKANIPARIAFRVASQIDSRTILDCSGAEKLLGNGDMLFLAGNQSKPKRIQSAFLTEGEVKKAVEYIIEEQKKLDAESAEEEIDILDKEDINNLARNSSSQIDFDSSLGSSDPSLEDDLYNDAKEIVLQAGKASASLLQRKLRIGYARAARLIDILEESGVVGQADGARPREVFYNGNSSPEMLEQKNSSTSLE